MLATYWLTENRPGEIHLSLTDNNIYFANRLMRSHDEAMVLDRIGNVKTGSSRKTNRKMRYAPFGEEDASTGENRIKYGTYVRDEMTGLDYAKRRYYSSELGRFISPDPYIESIRLHNPDSWNRYAYAENDPVNNIDPNGTFCQVGGYGFCDNFSCPMYSSFYDDGYGWSDYGGGDYIGCNPYGPDYSGGGGSGSWGGDGGGGDGGGGGSPIGPGHPVYDAHYARLIDTLLLYINTDLGGNYSKEDIESWIDSNDSHNGFTGGNLNLVFDPELIADVALRTALNNKHRGPFMYAIHVKTNPLRAHVDTFSPDGGLAYIILHGFWDVFVGTIFFNRTGLPGV